MSVLFMVKAKVGVHSTDYSVHCSSSSCWRHCHGLYADHLVVVADLLEACVRRLLIQKGTMEENGLRVIVHDVRYRLGSLAEFR